MGGLHELGNNEVLIIRIFIVVLSFVDIKYDSENVG